MRTAWALLAAHAAVLLGGVFSMLVLIPHPELWQHLPGAPTAYQIAIQHAGPVHIVLGALALLVGGAQIIGRRETAIFFAVSVPVSLTFELLGTGTGWPFGNYGYTQGLGHKIGGLVPYSIPLSWFYMGFTSYLLARLALRRWPGMSGWWAVPYGVALLMAWDLTLDPAMAYEAIPLKFWVWSERGAYLGMPLVNLAGWVVVGTVFMTAARALWRHDAAPPAEAGAWLFSVYAINVAFGALLCAGFGLWGPAIAGSVAALVPASVGMWPVPTAPAGGRSAAGQVGG